MTDGTRAVVTEIARNLGARLPELTTEMSGMFIEVIPEFRHDETVQRLMRASTSSNLSTVVDMMSLGISPEEVTVPAAAAEYARRFAQHDLSLEALLRAYRLGEHLVLGWSVRELRALDLPSDEALTVVGHLSGLVNGYIDRIIEGLIDIYQSERRQWEERSDAARAAQVRAVLDTPTLEISSAEEMLGLALRGWHIAAVVWVEPTGTELSGGLAQLRAVGRLLAEASGRAPMTVHPDGASLWAWVSFAGRPAFDTDRLNASLEEYPALRIALGEPGAGLAGFRASHQEALRARQVAEIGAQSIPRLCQHSQVALAGLLIDRRDDLRIWVRRVLGDLAQADESMGRLRDTLRTFLETNGSFTDAAARMHVHKNTVHYRVRKAEEIIGRPVTDGRLAIEVALLACDQLAVAAQPITSGAARERTPAGGSGRVPPGRSPRQR